MGLVPLEKGMAAKLGLVTPVCNNLGVLLEKGHKGEGCE